jgi:hypothetical protein
MAESTKGLLIMSTDEGREKFAAGGFARLIARGWLDGPIERARADEQARQEEHARADALIPAGLTHIPSAVFPKREG